MIIDERQVTRDTLVVDDISDSGKTLAPFEVKGCTIATLHLATTASTVPTFFVQHRKGDWIVYPWELLELKGGKNE
jgi:hypoxanthine phosphoribosyltransferase